MDLVQIYECFCDRTRLRLLHLLAQGPLCVCHFQEVLREPQVKISKHLGYLRARELVTTARNGNWIVYSLPAKPSRELDANLRCLQDCAQADKVFRQDLARLEKLRACGCEPAEVFGPVSSRKAKDEQKKSSVCLRA
jgi:ArsR family transcriptional regulator